MGWWSAAIMGGDTPLDDFGVICTVAVPGKYKGGNPSVLTRAVLDKALPKIRQRIAKYRGNDRNIALQVLGVTLMERGGKMPADLRKQIIAAAEADEWMREAGTSSERGQNVRAFIAKVKAYKTGTPVDCKHEEGTGLMEKLVDVLEGRP